MKIIASDFDGTIYIHKKIAENDLQAIYKWQSSGNLFGLVTGRDYPFLLEALKGYPLQPDFILSNNGAVLSDARGNTLYEEALPLQTVRDLLKWLKNKDILFAIAFTGEKRLKIDFPHKTELSLFYQELIPEAAINCLEKVVQINLSCPDGESGRQLTEEINCHWPDTEAFLNIRDIDIIRKGSSKANGVKRIQALYPHSAIITIGDAENDICMLREFHGYTLPHGTDAAKKASSGIVNNLTELVQHFGS